jgi:hypothetical protein
MQIIIAKNHKMKKKNSESELLTVGKIFFCYNFIL